MIIVLHPYFVQSQLLELYYHFFMMIPLQRLLFCILVIGAFISLPFIKRKSYTRIYFRCINNTLHVIFIIFLLLYKERLLTEKSLIDSLPLVVIFIIFTFTTDKLPVLALCHENASVYELFLPSLSLAFHN